MDHRFKEGDLRRGNEHSQYGVLPLGGERFAHGIPLVIEFLHFSQDQFPFLRLHIAPIVQHAVYRAPRYAAYLGKLFDGDHLIPSPDTIQCAHTHIIHQKCAREQCISEKFHLLYNMKK